MIPSLSRGILAIFGWKASKSVTLTNKCVLIGAPHTTNWDFPLTLLALSSMGVKFNWAAKHTLFFWPLGTLMKALGGMSVDRRRGASFLEGILARFASQERLVLAIAPEGTRAKSAHWKAGFYTIAHQAGVPIGLGYIDYARKVVGLEKIMHASGDLQADLDIIRAYYHDRVGKYPQNQGEIRIQERAASGRHGPPPERE